jgi:hypothetical protein
MYAAGKKKVYGRVGLELIGTALYNETDENGRRVLR